MSTWWSGASAKLDEIMEMLKGQMEEGKFLHLFMNATPFQQAMFMLALAWLHLWSLTVAYPQTRRAPGRRQGEERDKILDENADAAYYSGRVLSSQFYIGAEFPKFFGMAEAILAGETSVLKVSDQVFTGALKP